MHSPHYWTNIQYLTASVLLILDCMSAMSAPLLPEVLVGRQHDDEPSLPFASEGVQRYVWNGTYGPMLIEVRDGAAFVNGKRVMSMAELREPEFGAGA